MGDPLVSIITINFNHPEVTCDLLTSLQQITYPNIEVIVVDNASPDDDPLVIKQQFPGIIFIRSKINLGFAGGNNLGIRSAKGKYILLLNNDTVVEPGFLEPLVAKFESNPQIGAISPKIRFYYKPDTIQFAGITEFHPYTIRNRGIAFGRKDDGTFDHDSHTAFVHGAAMMVPAEVIHRVGLMAECYFLYYEEHDWATRIKKAGFQLWYIHNSVILHKESVSTGKLSPLKIYYLNRSRIIYLRRNTKGLTFMIAILYQLFIAAPKNALVFLLKGNPGHFRAYCQAINWHFRHFLSKEIHEQPAF